MQYIKERLNVSAHKYPIRCSHWVIDIPRFKLIHRCDQIGELLAISFLDLK